MKRQNLFAIVAAALLGGAVSSILAITIMQKRFVTTQDLLNPQLSLVSEQAGSTAGNVNFTYAAEQSVNSVVHVKPYIS